MSSKNSAIQFAFPYAHIARQETNTLVVDLDSDATRGLTTSAVEKRQHDEGTNILPQSKTGVFALLFRQIASPFTYILIAAAILALFLSELIDAGMIILFILINTTLGFYQEFKTEQALALLEDYLSGQTKVVRDGVIHTLDHRELVRGDIVLLKAGDKVPADIRLLKTDDVEIDESALTGESIPVSKTEKPHYTIEPTLFTANTMAFMGTTLISGDAQGIVVATGKHTLIGRISHATSSLKRVSGFEKNLRAFSNFTLITVFLTLGFVIIANILLKPGQDTGTLLLFAIALAVGVIPEGLPTVLTFSLSRGAVRLAKKKVIVRRLSAIEDLGSIEVLCCDKTGTLTENKLELVSTKTEDEAKLTLFGYLAGDTTTMTDPFDIAFKASTHATATLIAQYKRLDQLPFDPERRLSSVLVQHKQKKYLLLRGAPEALFVHSHMQSTVRTQWLHWINAEGNKGRRVLAVAYKSFSQSTYEAKDEKSGFTFLGLASFTDPIKESTIGALDKAKTLGIHVKIVTGDSLAVAKTVGRDVGLVDDVHGAVTGDELMQLSLTKQKQAVEQNNVFARVSPLQKYQIIELLKQNHEVGFLGEGINDAPALKIASVGLVVAHSSDVAREAADIVLMKKSLKTIINGIEEGRSVFANTLKYIKTTMSANFGNFYAVAIVSLFIDYLPMLPAQLLLLNLLTDLPMIVVATDSVETVDLKRPRSYDIKEVGLLSTILGFVSSAFDFITFRYFVSFGKSVLQTNWFITSVVTELLLLYSMRTRGIFFRAGRPSTSLIVLTIFALIACVALPFLNVGKNVFSFVNPDPNQLLIVLVIAGTYFILTETVKLLFYRTFSTHKTTSIN